MRRRRPAALGAPLAALLAALVLAGCGSGSSEAGVTATAVTGATAATATTGGGAVLAGEGVRLALPEGWRGRLVELPGAGGLTTLHAASYPLAAQPLSSFGGENVEQIPPDGVFIALVEAGPSLLEDPSYEAQGVPRIAASDLLADAAAGPLPAAAGGVQRAFRAAGRAWVLSVVVGSRADGEALVARANAVLGSLEIGRAPEAG